MTVWAIVDDINRTRPVASTTVMTAADILHAKDWLLREQKEGHAWLYEPARTREEYSAALMEDALSTIEDRPVALARFVGQMSPAELAALRKALCAVGKRTTT